MLEPQTRAALTEQLAPPPGFELAHAVGTTFTLDLETALTIPLSFASHRITAEDGNLGILDAIRRAADRIDVFAQAGELWMGRSSDLVAFLEPMVHPVATRRGLFHPKVWFLEFASSDERRYRFICASRNLTADRSWDVIVRLDGQPGEAGRDAATNAPLVRLLRTLPELSVIPLPAERQARIDELAERWTSVRWEPPDELRNLTFHVLGLPGSTPPDVRGQRSLIISPFVSDEGLRMLRAHTRTDTHLVSRAESLDQLAPESLDARLKTYVLDDAASLLDDSVPTGAPTREGEVPSPPEHLTGLHAKVIVADRQDGAHLFLGSANATDAALHANVEVMVELVGSVPKYGVDATREALGSILESYEATGGAEPSADEKALRRLERCLRRLAGVRFTARVLEGEPYSLAVWADSDERFVSSLRSSLNDRNQTGDRETDDDITVRWHLLTRPDLGGPGLAGTESHPHVLNSLELTDITPFLVLTARDSEGNERRTILLARLLDDIPTRRDAIIARQLTDRASFVRLLMLLLELSGHEFPVGGHGLGVFSAPVGGAEGAGLFESLVRAVGAGHQGLADVRRIVDYLLTTDDGAGVLPDGFADLWSAVWETHVRLTGTEDAA